MAFSGISLNEDVSFSGKCGKMTIGGTIMGDINTYFAPLDVRATIAGKTIFRSEDDNRAISNPEHMSVNCLGSDDNPKLLIGINCVAHAPVCGKTWFYVFDANTGTLLAPQDVKSEKALCNAKCADKAMGGGTTAQTLEKERYR